MRRALADRVSRRVCRALAAGAMLVAFGGCSPLIHDDPAQCQGDGDCARFAGTTCVAGGCVPRVKVATPPPDATACTTTQDCIALQGEPYSICRKRDHACITLLSKDCTPPLGA